MTLLKSVQSKIKNATQEDLDSVFVTFPNSMTESRILADNAKLNDFIQKVQARIDSKLSVTASASLVNHVEISKVTLPETDSVIDIENMTLEQILVADKKAEDEAKRSQAIANLRAKQKNLIEIKEKNLADSLALQSSEASYQLRLNSQPQLLALSIDNAKTLQAEIIDREIKSIEGITQAKRKTPTAFEIMEHRAKKSQQIEINTVTDILNSIPEAIPQMKLSGVATTESQNQTVDVAVI